MKSQLESYFHEIDNLVDLRYLGSNMSKDGIITLFSKKAEHIVNGNVVGSNAGDLPFDKNSLKQYLQNNNDWYETIFDSNF